MKSTHWSVASISPAEPGRDPIDRIMGALVANLGLDWQAASTFTGSSKSFFINRLFHELTFREAGLAGGTDLRV